MSQSQNGQRRQQRFLYDLAQLHDHQTTFELRLVSWPQEHGPTRVGIAFLGKVFHENRQHSRLLATALWDKFSALFPREAPFSSPLIPIGDEKESRSQQTRSFANWYQPLPFELLDAPACIVELRKYEDWPTVRDVGGVLHPHDYIPHPFEPALDYSALGRLFQALAHQRHTCIVAITLRPQRLTDQEIIMLYETLGWYRRLADGEVTLNNPLIDVLQEMNSDIFTIYLRTRAAVGIKVYETLIRELDNLFTVRLQVVGFPAAQLDLVEALGSEMTADVDSLYPSRWTATEPSPDELHAARFNLQWLEFARWGISPIINQAPVLTRFRQLATAAEAMGAFRLPIASSGGLAGVDVHDEPFFLPPQTAHPRTSFPFGLLVDRGVVTDIPCLLPRKIFTKLIPVFGEKGQCRNAVAATLLQVASTSGLPWVLIRGSAPDSPAPLAATNVQHISIDALDTQPALIQPFFPPPAVPLPPFVDALQRVFTVTCQLESACAIVLRRALLDSYQYIHEQNEQTSLSNLIRQLRRTLQNIQAPSDVLTTLETRMVLPLQDLLMTTNLLFEDPPATQSEWWTTPTCIDIAWVGSEQTRAIIAGCLWVHCALTLAEQPAKTEAIRGIVGIEEARTVFAASSWRMNYQASRFPCAAWSVATRQSPRYRSLKCKTTFTFACAASSRKSKTAGT